ncbi:MAG: tetratricopeptide repeat protein [Candidatus Obscuribacterales bacterium]
MTGTKVAKIKDPLDKYRKWAWTTQSIFLAVWLAMSAWLIIDAVLHPTIYYLVVNMALLLFWNIVALPPAVASILSMQLMKCQESGNYPQVEKSYTCLQRRTPWLFSFNKKVASTNYCNLGTARLLQGNFDGAEQAYDKAVAAGSTNKKFLTTPYMGLLYNNLAVCLMHQGRFEEAEHIALNAVSLAQQKSAKKWGAVQGLPLCTLGSILILQNRLDEAKERLDEAHPYVLDDPGRGSVRPAYHMYRALLDARQGDIDASLAVFKDLMDIKESNPHCVTTLAIMPLYLLANEYMNAKRYQAAEQALHTAYAVAKQNPVHPVSIRLRSFCEKYLLLTNRQSEVADMHSWLWESPKDIPQLTQEGGKQK